MTVVYIVVCVADGESKAGPVLYQLRHADHDTVEAEQRRRTGVQRVRPVLQTARRQQAAGNAEGRNTDEEAQTEEVFDAGFHGQLAVGRRRKRFHWR